MIDELERQIEQRILAGADLDEIEAEIIERAPVDEEHQAVLWLYAEALRSRRREASRALALPPA